MTYKTQVQNETISGAKTFNSGIIIGGNTTSDANLGTISSVTDSSYYVGTFNADLTGGITTTTTCNYVKHGKSVTLRFTGVLSTGSAAPIVAAAGQVPSGLAPAFPGTNFPIFVRNNNADEAYPGYINIDTNGSIYIGKTFLSPNFTANGTASSTGFYGTSITYQTA